MLKKVIKKIIVSAFVLYGYNLISLPLNLIVPINIYTVLILSILGLPSIFSLILIKFIFF